MEPAVRMVVMRDGWAYVPALLWFAFGGLTRKGGSASSGSGGDSPDGKMTPELLIISSILEFLLSHTPSFCSVAPPVSPASSNGTALTEENKGDACLAVTVSDDGPAYDGDDAVASSALLESVFEKVVGWFRNMFKW